MCKGGAVIHTNTHASLVEVAHRGRKTLEWAQQQAREGKIAAELTKDGWLVERPLAEALVVQWLNDD